MPSTSGFGVQVMPQIQFADGAQLAGRGPGEAIAGFNSGIGAINAIQNTRQKALLAPIEQQEAQARLAQIVGSNDFNQQLRPYQLADARYQAAKTQIPIKDQTGFELIKVPQMNADGTPSVDDQGNPVYNVMKRATGNEINAATGAISPFQEITGVQTPADTLNLHAALAQKARDYADLQAQFNAIRQQRADTGAAAQLATARHYQDQFNLGSSKNTIAQQRADTPHFSSLQGVDANGNLVLLPFNSKTGTVGTNISTGVQPNRTIDPLAAEIAAQMAEAKKRAAAGGTTTTTPAQTSGIRNWINNHNPFSSSPTTGQPVTTLPVIPLGQASANPGPPDAPALDELSQYFNPAQPGTIPTGEIQVGKFKVRQK